ncbi:MAG: TPM domain-containing protein [Steroidobacteraceae bacterium]
MSLGRLVRHLFTTHWRVRWVFPRAALEAIERAIRESRTQHVGEIRFAVEGALHGARLYHGQSPRERAIEVFSLLRMWDTEHRNGVLIYLLLADRAVEIVADRGAHARIGSEGWEGICCKMQAAFREGRYEAGAIAGIQMVTACLAEHFPARASERNELPDAPAVL